MGWRQKKDAGTEGETSASSERHETVEEEKVADAEARLHAKRHPVKLPLVWHADVGHVGVGRGAPLEHGLCVICRTTVT